MAAQKIEYGIVEGTALRVDRNVGSFNNERGEAVAYDYFELRVLSPEADLSVLRVPADNSGRPAV
ncbi:hypothetical protein, partial [Cellulomonas alba]